jgi:hypothetical protein
VDHSASLFLAGICLLPCAVCALVTLQQAPVKMCSLWRKLVFGALQQGLCACCHLATAGVEGQQCLLSDGVYLSAAACQAGCGPVHGHRSSWVDCCAPGCRSNVYCMYGLAASGQQGHMCVYMQPCLAHRVACHVSWLCAGRRHHLQGWASCTWGDPHRLPGCSHLHTFWTGSHRQPCLPTAGAYKPRHALQWLGTPAVAGAKLHSVCSSGHLGLVNPVTHFQCSIVHSCSRPCQPALQGALLKQRQPALRGARCRVAPVTCVWPNMQLPVAAQLPAYLPPAALWAAGGMHVM